MILSLRYLVKENYMKDLENMALRILKFKVHMMELLQHN